MMLIYFTFCFNLYSAIQMYEPGYDSTLVVSKMLIHDIDEDGNQDTVIGRYCSEYKILPYFVKWGIDSLQTNINDSLLPRYSTFHYPNYYYDYLTCVLNIYSGDTTSNILIMTEGAFCDTVNSVYYCRDTSNCFLVYFTPELRRVDHVRLDTIQTSMINPYKVMVIPNNNFDSSTVTVIPYDIKNTILAKSIFEYQAELKAIENILHDNNIKLFPNPCSSQLYYEFNCLEVGEYNVQLFDNNGNIVYRDYINNTTKKNIYTKEIYIKYFLPSGNYCFVVLNQGEIIFKQNVIIRN